MIKKWISVIILCSSLNAFGQQDFSWEAKLPVPDTTGYYHIAITPAVSARAYRAGNWDLRIFSGTKEVPYVLNQDFLKDNNTNSFKAFGMPLLEVKPNVATTVIFEQGMQKSLSEFGLRYTNTTVRKKIVLTASNDKVTWYALREPFLLDPASAVLIGTLREETISIPTSSFRYYKLVINDSASAPLQINCVGYRSIPQLFPTHTEVPVVTWKLLPGKDRKEDKYLIDLHDSYPVSHLIVKVKAPVMYHRNAKLTAPVQSFERTLSEFTLSSEVPGLKVILPSQQTYDSIYLTIPNGDNPPLELEEVTVWQHTYYLIAYLEKGKEYALKGGDVRLSIPKYDVEHFKEVYASLAQHMIQPEAPVLKMKPVAEASATFFNSKWWVWAGIGFIIVLLGFVVIRMMRDLKKDTSN